MKKSCILISLFDTNGPISLNISDQKFSNEDIFLQFVNSSNFHKIKFINCLFEECDFVGTIFSFCHF